MHNVTLCMQNEDTITDAPDAKNWVQPLSVNFVA